MTLYFRQALMQVIEDSGLPLITEYSLYNLAHPILRDGTHRNDKVRMVPSQWQRHQLKAMIRTLTKNKVLAPDGDFKAGAWHVVGSLAAASAEDAICLVDPFAYISHLSAMQRYGLTDRSPEALHMTTPVRALWTTMRNERMSRLDWDLNKDEKPLLARIGFGPVVRRRPVTLHESSHPSPTIDIAGERARIASVGHVFVNMLDQPWLCGGMAHVLDCYDRHAENWINEIVDAVNAVDSPIIKVRAGYIIDELLGLSMDKVESWTACAQRGGSRKLDPKAPYGNVYSEKWMIALNAG